MTTTMKELFKKLRIVLPVVMITSLLVTILCYSRLSFQSHANEGGAISGTVTELGFDADAYADKDTSSEVKASFSSGDSVFVTEESDGWYRIFYKGEMLYIKIPDTVNSEPEQQAESQRSISGPHDAYIAELDKEFKEQESAVAYLADTVEKQKKARINSLVWKIIIGVLVVAIIVVTVVIAVKNKEEDDEDR